jgi:hypothetical protein
MQWQTKGLPGVGQFWMPISAKGGALLQADLHFKIIVQRGLTSQILGAKDCPTYP